jgi:alpha-beta hydrolase superfamily lysophospholipase
VKRLDLKIDVTESTGLGEPAHVAVTLCLPDPSTLAERPVVCFAKPGGGYSRGYYTEDLPGPARGAQADWHVARGWIFVAVDHLGVGDSSLHAPEKLSFAPVVAGNHAAEQEVLRRLAAGMLDSGFPAIADPLKIGIGQSMGGCATVLQQGRYRDYDGIGVLGYSAIHTHPPVRSGEVPIVHPWVPRDLAGADFTMLNPDEVAASPHPKNPGQRMAWGFHWDDVSADVVEADLSRFDAAIEKRDGEAEASCPPYGSMTRPGMMAMQTLCPGAIAPEAAAVRVPVLCAMGERDVVSDPMAEPKAFRSAHSVDVYVCPRMGHMHNFAGTRELFWQRIAIWADWVAISALTR